MATQVTDVAFAEEVKMQIGSLEETLFGEAQHGAEDTVTVHV